MYIVLHLKMVVKTNDLTTFLFFWGGGVGVGGGAGLGGCFKNCSVVLILMKDRIYHLREKWKNCLPKI